jgi:hypothetical protein
MSDSKITKLTNRLGQSYPIYMFTHRHLTFTIERKRDRRLSIWLYPNKSKDRDLYDWWLDHWEFLEHKDYCFDITVEFVHEQVADFKQRLNHDPTTVTLVKSKLSNLYRWL